MKKPLLCLACLVALGQTLAGPDPLAESLKQLEVFDDLELDQPLAEPLVKSRFS